MTHLIGFGGDKSLSRSTNTIPVYLDDYIALIDWTGRAIVRQWYLHHRLRYLVICTEKIIKGIPYTSRCLNWRMV